MIGVLGVEGARDRDANANQLLVRLALVRKAGLTELQQARARAFWIFAYGVAGLFPLQDPTPKVGQGYGDV